MPIFEYICGECRNRFELIVNGSTTPECPACHSQRLDKQLSVFAVGAPRAASSSPVPAGACGTCGDPRGPGSCSLN
jgi:putative FmdB family regulatory protein